MITRFTTTLLVCFAAFTTFLQAQTVHPWCLDGEIYVKYKNSYTMPAYGPNGVYAAAALPGVDENLSKKYGVNRVQSSFFAAQSTELTHTLRVSLGKNKTTELINFLTTFSFIEYAEPVPYNTTGYTPNDLGPYSTSGQWYLWKINAQAAWDISRGDSAIKVAVVDDAVQVYHEDLYANIWRNPGEIAGNQIDDDNNGYIDDIYGYDVGDGDNDMVQPNTGFTHGTHVSGISGAVSDNGKGIASIGFNISIIGVKCTNNGQTNTQSIPFGYEGITYATNAKADIINCSWSSAFFSQTGKNVINYSVARGCFIVAAASNEGLDQLHYPAAFDGVFAVASTEANDMKSSYSNYGTWVDISAPGSNINSTVSTGGYMLLSGTSMASPLVAGLAGLMKSAAPNITNQQLEQCIRTSADSIYTINPLYKNKLGNGRINAEKALACIQGISTKPEAAFTANTPIACPNTPIEFSPVSTGGKAASYSWRFPGGTPSASTQQNPTVVYPDKGYYDVTLVEHNSQGTDSVTRRNYIHISHLGRNKIYSEDFESGTLATMGYTIVNPNNDITWSLATVGGLYEGNRALYMNFYNYSQTGRRDALISPVLDFSGHANVQLNMVHAYRRQNNTRRDSLIIYASADNGATYPFRVAAFAEDTVGYYFATAPNLATPFTPTKRSDWCFEALIGSGCKTIDLSMLDGLSNVRLKFETYNGYGNNLYIDKIEITGSCESYNSDKVNTTSNADNSPQRGPAITTSANSVENTSLTVYPNPANAELFINGLEEGTPATVSFTDVLGRNVLQQAATNNTAVNIAGLAPGMYMLTIQQGTVTIVRKIVVE